MRSRQEVEAENHFPQEKDVPSGNAKQVHRIISNLIITSSTRMKEDIYHDYLDKDLSGDSGQSTTTSRDQEGAQGRGV